MSNDEPAKQPKAAHPATVTANTKVANELPFDDTRDFDDARRGFIAALPDGDINTARGSAVWRLSNYRFIEGDVAPDTVNPSLWRQARLNLNHGLFEVVPGLYQLRGMDLANMTVIEGDEGIIIIDPLTVVEGARAALDLYYAERGTRPVKAVIYSHSHVDH